MNPTQPTIAHVSAEGGPAVAKMQVVGILMTYNCAGMVEGAFRSIPLEYFHQVICVDDGSTDDTVAVVEKLGIPVFTHPHTGYGGNLFYGFGKALQMGATHFIELHGDGQYDFAAVPPAIGLMSAGCDLVLGNRFYDLRQPLRDGMDLIRYLGNIFLSTIGRVGLGIPTRDLFPGFRAYSRRCVETFDIEHTSSNYFFSFEVIAQARFCGLAISQVPVQCDYKREHTSMTLWNGIPAIMHTCQTVMQYRLALLNIKRGVFKSLRRPDGNRARGG